MYKKKLPLCGPQSVELGTTDWCMISLSALLTKYTLGIMNNLGHNQPTGGAGSGAGGGGGVNGSGIGNNNGNVIQNPAAEGSMERGR